MRKVLNHIIHFVLIIAGLVIFSHSIIPHDHHYEIACNDSKDEFPDHQHSPEHPVHCHLFNEIIIDNSIIAQNQEIIRHSQMLFACVYQLNLHPEVVKYINAVFGEKIQFQNTIEIVKGSPTRGSPSFLG